MRQIAIGTVLCAIAACTSLADDDANCTGGKCDGSGPSCADPRYGDGVCQTDIDCAEPDIDCFTTFDDDDAAAKWFADFEAKRAMQESRAPRATLPTTDPHYAKARALADQGWAAFRVQRPVGALAEKRPGVVVIQDSAVNAFVAPDLATGKAGFVIMVQTGLLDLQASDDSKLGVMMHELQHAVGLHVVGDVAQKLRRYYVASDDAEPIGRRETDSPPVRQAGTAWADAATLIGGYSTEALGGIPMSGSPLALGFDRLRTRALAANPTGCARAVDLMTQLSQQAVGGIDPLSGAIAGDSAQLSQEADAVMAAMRDECMPGETESLVDLLAEVFGVPADTIRMELGPDVLAAIDGKHVIDAIATLTKLARGKMRDLEAQFERDVAPWHDLRYFSSEEDADDTSVLVLRGTRFAPAAIGDFFLGLLGDTGALCKPYVDDRRVPPYGVDLNDAHHATCWRAYHVNAFADAEAAGGASSARVVPSHVGPTVVAKPRVLVPLADRLAY